MLQWHILLNRSLTSQMTNPCLHTFPTLLSNCQSKLDFCLPRVSTLLPAEKHPYIPEEISESTGMKFISHMAASAPPNHNLY